MLATLHFARRVIDNPRLLIAVAVLVGFMLILQVTLFTAPWGNPLPDPDDVRSAAIRLSGPEGPVEVSLPVSVYAELHECLDGSDPVPPGTFGYSPIGTLVVRKTDSTSYRVRLYPHGAVGTEIGVFVPTDEGLQARLDALMPKITSYIASVAKL